MYVNGSLRPEDRRLRKARLYGTACKVREDMGTSARGTARWKERRKFMLEHCMQCSRSGHLQYLTTRCYRSTMLSFPPASTTHTHSLLHLPQLPCRQPKERRGHEGICPGRSTHFHALHNCIVFLSHSNLPACPTSSPSSTLQTSGNGEIMCES